MSETGPAEAPEVDTPEARATDAESGTNRGLLSEFDTQILNGELRNAIYGRHFGLKTTPGKPGGPPPSPRFVPVS